LLFCSNGVTDAVPTSLLARSFEGGPVATSIATSIMAAAERAGAEDDATAIVAWIGPLVAGAPRRGARPQGRSNAI
jgi:hypothetical protein